MTSGQARVLSGERDGEVLLPLITADCHRGRMTGQARMRTEGAGVSTGEKSTGGQAASGTVAGGTGDEHGLSKTPSRGTRTYEAELSMAGVQFGPLLSDFAQWSKETAPDAPKAAEQLETPVKAGALDRGSLDARVSLSGVVGDESSRLGRGEARVGGGQVVNFPLVMRLIRVSNLQLPINDRVEVARASFYMAGDTVTFEDVCLFGQLAVDLFQLRLLRLHHPHLCKLFRRHQKRQAAQANKRLRANRHGGRAGNS